MITDIIYPHIVKPSIGAACLEKHPRTRVSMIVTDYQGRGWSAEEIVHQYPYLTLAEVHSALAYYYDHTAEIDLELAEEFEEAGRSRLQSPETPLLRRMRRLKPESTSERKSKES